MITRTPIRDRFVVISKVPLEDARLSWKARGIHAYLMSKPDNWNVIVGHLVSQSPKEGRDAVRGALMELEKAGYIRRTKTKSEQGQYDGVDTEVFEEPIVLPDKTGDGSTGYGLPGAGESPTNEELELQKKENELSSLTSGETQKIFSSQVLELTKQLHDWIVMNGYKPFTLGPKQWADMDKLLRIDKRDPQEVSAVIEWCQRDAFWNVNIRSTFKLRQKYDQLLGRMRQEGVAPAVSTPFILPEEKKVIAEYYDAHYHQEEWFDPTTMEFTLDNPDEKGYTRPRNDKGQLVDASGVPYTIDVQGVRRKAEE